MSLSANIEVLTKVELAELRQESYAAGVQRGKFEALGMSFTSLMESCKEEMLEAILPGCTGEAESVPDNAEQIKIWKKQREHHKIASEAFDRIIKNLKEAAAQSIK
jgi:hypothetical protein